MAICSAEGVEVQCAGGCFVLVMFGADSAAFCADEVTFTPPVFKAARSDTVTVDIKEFPAERLDEILGHLVDEPLTRAEARTEPVELSFKGTVDELLEQVGLGRDDGGGGGGYGA
jgi:hypothetical protein